MEAALPDSFFMTIRRGGWKIRPALSERLLALNAAHALESVE
jgi:hypothetical protein